MSGQITILGAGVAGLCMATELVARGYDVRLIDPKGGPGAHGCSWWAGGMLAPDCEGAVAEEPVVRHGRKAAEWWTANGAEITYGGSLVVALGRDRQELDRFARRTDRFDWITRDRLTEFEPDLADRFDRALFMTGESHLNPRPVLLTLRERLKSNGVQVETTGTPTGQVIDCRGLSAADRLSRSAMVDIMKPGEQNAHWNPWASCMACWTGWSVPSGAASPSMVVMSAPSACTASIRQERAGWPSTSTVHAPQTPCSQPTWVPVSPISCRRKSLNRLRGSTTRL